jgi:hypothetical protein
MLPHRRRCAMLSTVNSRILAIAADVRFPRKRTDIGVARYYLGLAIILLSWLPAWVYAYFPAALPAGNARIYLLAAMDLAFVASVFLMGGEFWEKVRRIFIYEGKV